MKDFSKVKIACCMLVHNDEEMIQRLLSDVSKYASEVYINLNEATPKIVQAVQGCSKLKGIKVTKNMGRKNWSNEPDDWDGKDKTWNQGLQRDNTIRMLDEVKPDIVLFPDSDEIYPNNLMEQLKEFWEDEEKITFWFRLLYMWNDEQHFRNDGLYKRIHHVRAYKWQPNITYKPYAGYACPTTFINLPRETRFNSNAPTKHYGYMTEELRDRKYSRYVKDYINDEKFRAKIDDGMIIKSIEGIKEIQ